MFFTNFIGNNSLMTVQQKLFSLIEMFTGDKGLYCIDTFIYFQVLKSHLELSNCHPFMKSIYRDNLSDRNKKVCNTCDRWYTKYPILHNTILNFAESVDVQQFALLMILTKHLMLQYMQEFVDITHYKIHKWPFHLQQHGEADQKCALTSSELAASTQLSM